jgi:plastocyanin
MRCVTAVALLLMLGCSSHPDGDAQGGDASLAGGDDGATAEAGAEGGDATVVFPDAAPPSDVALDPYDDTTNFNDCTPFDFTSNDHTADADPRTIQFSLDPTTQQYAPRCVKIRAGQTVTWTGAFQYHPLSPAGGDVPSPITIDPQPGGSSRVITFPKAGLFGFECSIHEAPLEYGAIQVIP